MILPRFDVVLSYDLGNGVRIEKGGEIVTKWPAFKENPELPRAPRAATEWLTRFFRYSANLARLGQESHQIGFYHEVRASRRARAARRAQLRPQRAGHAHARLGGRRSAHASLAGHVPRRREPQRSASAARQPSRAPRRSRCRCRRPRSCATRLQLLVDGTRRLSLAEFAPAYDTLAQQLTGTTLTSVENLLRVKSHAHEVLHARRPRLDAQGAGRERLRRPDRVHRIEAHARRLPRARSA